jgi:hypothetical protein
MQQPGLQYAARLIEHTAGSECDVLHLDMQGAYPPEAGLTTLERRIVFHRDAPEGWVELEDRYIFQNGPASFESAITTFGKVEIGENAVIIHGLNGKLRVGFDAQTIAARAELFSQVDLSDGMLDVYRVVFSPREDQVSGVIRLEIIPVE